MASISNTQRRQDTLDAELTASRTSHERELDKAREDYEENLTSAKKEYNERLNQERQEAQIDTRKLKEEMYDRKGKRFAADAVDFQKEKANYQRYREDIEKETARKLQKADEDYKSRSKTGYEDSQKKIEDAIRAEKRSMANEVKEMKRELDAYRAYGTDVEKEKAAAKANLIDQYEADTIREMNRISESYQHEIENLKEGHDILRETQEANTHEALIRAQANAEKMVSDQKKDFLKAQRDKQTESSFKEGRLKEQLKNAEIQHQRAEKTLVENNETDRTRALNNKDRVYNEYLKDKNTAINYDMGRKDAEIHELKTTSDPLKASPYLVSKLQTDAELRNHQKLLKAQEVHNGNLDAERKRDLQERNELRDEYRERFTNFTRDTSRSHDVASQQYLTAYKQLNETRTQEKEEMKKSHNELNTRWAEKHSLELTREQRRAKEEMDSQRDELLYLENQSQEEVEARARLQDREWNMRINSIHRDFQKKMTEQQDLHERQMSELRYDYDKRLRDQERTKDRAANDRVKNYEHQIKQQELAFKERERFLIEHYEEELDRMKRSNARIIQKKS